MANEKRFKIQMLGDESSGKRSLLLKFLEKAIDDREECNLDYGEGGLEIDGTELQIQLWTIEPPKDFAVSYSATDGVIVVFDLANRDSFENAKEKWFKQLYNTPYALPYLIGNKSDLSETRQVEENEGKQLASQWACVGYSEVSALTGVGLKSAVSELCQEIIQQHMLMNPQQPEEKQEEEVEDDGKGVDKTDPAGCCSIS
mmetsp:Transcript_33816/g.46264  ORF Transcript_33816/g.46264 Transcript_33816/m.46264 type:complete len:201 (+) Transcript_33816:89-691(+)|eukprot:CAMPEP_0201488566 /NCGR_PEP_ID=MMETSP0151_2-20130828/19032_1 /ASSEMBLY_ACC=CAM_ASM_000257 /TAXON_ID=200890 /ORGANISM="Paramoeba atlantica, Strain 621/1 / CCAP 1560/9" /LENGTH=200 /DNA_ID=CAMNT_0047873887 /DNA_START=86 /DNA_END=688 /DNA_ORIENTATION=-